MLCLEAEELGFCSPTQGLLLVVRCQHWRPGIAELRDKLIKTELKGLRCRSSISVFLQKVFAE